jgi:type VI secretion system protein ImpA
MPSPATLDVEALLVRIPGEHPAGESLRYVGTYDAIQEARRSDDELAQGEWVREPKVADWQAVIQLCSEALASKSKDLQIAVWLVEALVKRHGFPGLRDGLRLLWALQERFWDGLYPEVEDGDLEFRAAPLMWLNDKLPPALRQSPLTQGSNGERYSWLHWDESRLVDNLGRRDQAAMQAALADGKITGEQFDKAADTTPLA